MTVTFSKTFSIVFCIPSSMKKKDKLYSSRMKKLKKESDESYCGSGKNVQYITRLIHSLMGEQQDDSLGTIGL